MPTFTGDNQVWSTDPSQLAQLDEAGPDGPIYMINLLKFKDQAEYEDGRETSLTGQEAYNLYGREVVKIMQDYEAEPVFLAFPTYLQIGQLSDLWDEIVIVRYPNRKALADMTASSTWQAANVHRKAGLAGQLNIESVGPGPIGAMLATQNEGEL